MHQATSLCPCFRLRLPLYMEGTPLASMQESDPRIEHLKKQLTSETKFHFMLVTLEPFIIVCSY